MKRILIAWLAVFATTRCATIVHGRYQTVPVSSDPAGATVRVDCGDAPNDGSITPAVVSLRRRATSCAITLSKPGYDVKTIVFTRKWSAVAWSNLAPALLVEGAAEYASAQVSFLNDNPSNNNSSGGNGLAFVAVAGAGLLIDHSTGAMYRQEPSRVDAVLRRHQ